MHSLHSGLIGTSYLYASLFIRLVFYIGNECKMFKLNLYRKFIHSLVFRPRGRSGRNQSPVMEPMWLLAHCILGKFLGVVCHCFPPPLDVPTFAATCLS